MVDEEWCIKRSKDTPFIFNRLDIENKKVYFYDGSLLCVCGVKSFPPRYRGIKIAVDKTEAFKREASSRHNGRYDYGNVVYMGCDGKISVTCKKHGDFNTTPHMHLSDMHGCSECNIEKQRKGNGEIIRLCRERHGDKYKYDFSSYSGSIKKSKIRITCKVHGVFVQTPYNHYSCGQGCPLCGRITQGGKSKSDHVLTSMKNGGESWLYLIRCYSENEIFYKVGITVNGVNERFSSSNMPYSFEVVRELCFIAETTWSLEKSIMTKLTQYQYMPDIYFSGYTECFSCDNEVLRIFDEEHLNTT